MKTITDINKANKFLQNFCDADLKIWAFDITHKKLTLLLKKEQNEAFIIGISCEKINMNFHSKDSKIMISSKVNEFGEKYTLITNIINNEYLITSGGFIITY